MPLISLVFIKLCLTVNFMILITTLILYFKGPYFFNQRKYGVFYKIIFRAFVPNYAFQHYEALMMYRHLVKD